MKLIKRYLLPAILTVFCIGVMQASADKIFLKDGSTHVGKSIRYKRTTEEYIMDKDGVQATFPKSRVERVDATKPAKYDAAVAQVKARDFNGAISTLQEIIKEFEGLGWDNKARDMLAIAYSEKGETKKAADTYDELMKRALPSEITSDMTRRHQAALVADGRTAQVGRQVDDIIAKGSRASAAVALLTRGDMYKKQNKMFEALIDYLKVVILFEQEKAAQPEALYKTMQCLEEMRDPRSDQFKRKLIADYAQSEWAVKAQGQAK